MGLVMCALASSGCWDLGTCLFYRIQGFLHFIVHKHVNALGIKWSVHNTVDWYPYKVVNWFQPSNLHKCFIHILLYLEYLAIYDFLLVHTAKNEIIYHEFFRASCIAKYRQHSSIGQIGVHNEIRGPCEYLWNVDTSLQLTLSEGDIAKFIKKMTLHTVIMTSEQASHYIMWFMGKC